MVKVDRKVRGAGHDRVVRSLPALGALLMLGGCAIFEPENRRLLELLDADLAPPPGAAAIALTPVTLPVGVVALAADMVVVHPVASIDDAWLDTRDVLWHSTDETSFRKVVMAPVSVLLTPVIFTGDWLGRSLFAIPARKPEANKEDDRR